MDAALYTKDQVLNEYRVGMQMVADQFQALVGVEAAAGIAQMAPEELTELGPNLSPSAALLGSPGAKILEQAYEFSMNGHLTEWLADEIEDHGPRRWKGMFAGLQQLVSSEWGGRRFEKCIHVMQLADLRTVFMPGTVTMAFDDAGHVEGMLSLKEVALLAGVEEKTVRNMGSVNHKQHLKMIKRGTRTFVPVEVANSWLLARGYKPTIFENLSADRNLRNYSFYSRADLAAYVRAQRENLGISLEQVSDASHFGEELGALIRALEQSVPLAENAPLTEVAKRLGVSDPEEFVSSVAEVL